MGSSKNVAIIGYSGHALVVCDIFQSVGTHLIGYFEKEEKSVNPYALPFLGSENMIDKQFLASCPNLFIAIGSNSTRERLSIELQKKGIPLLVVAQHAKAIVSSLAKVGPGTMISAGATINACVTIGRGVICNTQSIIEHECKLGDFSSIGPGAVLCGNVVIGNNTLIGANAIIKEGVFIGQHVTVGAGAVVLKDVPDHSKVVGNPIRYL